MNIRILLRTFIALPLLCWLGFGTGALAAFVKIEDFNGHALNANVSSTGGWSSFNGSNATTPVVLDPAGGTNRVLAVQNSTTAYVYRAVSIPNNTTATLFLRFRYSGTGGQNYSFGMSDVMFPNAFSAFESQFNQAANTNANFRDGLPFRALSPASPLQADTWYNIWMVINNSTDTTTVYLDSTTVPGATTSALQSSSGATAFTFRNGAAAFAMVNFLITPSAGHTGALYLDDLWLDAAGATLVNPIPATSNLVLAVNDSVEVGIGGAIAFDPTVNDTTTSGTIDKSSLTLLTQPTAGTATFNAAAGKVLYRHTGTAAGTDSFTYRVGNTTGATGTATVQVSLSGAMRLANTTLTVPQNPPASAGALQLVDAFPGLTFDGIVSMASVPGATNRLIVASAHGASTGSDSKVWMIPDTAAATPVKRELFEVDSLCPAPFTRGRGIYSVVCHPNFASNGQIIVCYQGTPDGFPVPTNQLPNLVKNGAPYSTINCTLRVSRFTITTAQLNTLLTSSNTALLNQTRADIVATELRYLNLAEQDLFHSINDAHFDNAGYLYVSFGDEGDQSEPYRNAQSIIKDQYSSIIRIDIDKNKPGSIEPNPHYAIVVNPGTGLANFSVPGDNPFVHTSLGGPWNGSFNGTNLSSNLGQVRTEMWAVGTRNPFKFHLDNNAGVTEAWVGDVGMDAWEEVSLLRKGDNAGWSYWEGTHPSGIAHAIPALVHKAPEWDYTHVSGNNCVIGGVLYRGTAYAAPLNGKYLFGDHGSGQLWTLDPAVSGPGKVQNLGVGTISLVVDFHVDPLTGHVLIAQYQSGKKIYRLKEAAPTSDNFPQLLSQTGAFADLATLTPNPGLVPYEPNLKFWSDHADKARWFSIPNTTAQMGYSRDSAWTFPVGQIFVKHFDMELNRSFPGTNRKRLETRFLVRNPGGTYGVSYRWDDQGTDATLVGISGVDFDLAIREGGTNNAGTVTGGTIFNQSWRIPARGECLTCHNPTAGHALSPTTEQLNKMGQLGQGTGNYLNLLAQSGYLAGFTDSAATLPRFYRPDEAGVNLDDRVRSYLAVNCSYCHQPNTGIVESWDGRGHLSIDAMRVLYGLPVSETFHGPEDRLIIPGNKLDSVIWNRIQARNVIAGGTFNGFSQMPPLATNTPDPAGIALLSQWIDFHANAAPAITAPAAISVTENAPLGGTVAGISASDPDTRVGQPDNNFLSYSITAGNPNGLFTINPATGQISINGVLDYEVSTQHTLQITASDNFTANPRTAVHSLNVNLQNVANEDANGNGIPDWWEASFAVSLAHGGDADKDGVLDFFEYIAGSDPENPDLASSLSLRVTAYVSGPTPGYYVTWRARNGLLLNQHYFAAAAATPGGTWATLQPPNYQIISATPIAPGLSEILIFVPASGSSFFHLSPQAE